MKIKELGKLYIEDAYNAIVNAEPEDGGTWKNRVIRNVNKLLSSKEISAKVIAIIFNKPQNEIVLTALVHNYAEFEIVVNFEYKNTVYARDGIVSTSFDKAGSIGKDFELMAEVEQVVESINASDRSFIEELYNVVLTEYNKYRTMYRIFYYKKCIADILNTAEKKGNFRLFLKELGKYYDADSYYHKRQDLLQSYDFYTEALESIMTQLAGNKFQGRFDFVWSANNTDKSMFCELRPKNDKFAELFSNFIFKFSIAVVEGGDKYSLKNSYFRPGFSGTFKQTAGISKEEASNYFDAMDDFLSNVTIEKLQEKLVELRFADKRNFISEIEFHKCLGFLLKSIIEINTSGINI